MTARIAHGEHPHTDEGHHDHAHSHEGHEPRTMIRMATMIIRTIMPMNTTITTRMVTTMGIIMNMLQARRLPRNRTRKWRPPLRSTAVATERPVSAEAHDHGHDDHAHEHA